MEERFYKRYESFKRSLDALAEARQRDMSDSFVLSGTTAKFSIAMNLGMDAFTSFLLLNLFGKRGSFMDPRLVSLPVIKLPLISRIPYVGEVLGAHNIVVYLTLLAVAGTWIAMYKTPFGLRLRSVGINEKAAQTTGTNVLRYKWYSVLITGFFVGIAGAILPLGGTSIFTENMSAGRGFLAVAAIMIAKGNPVMAAVYSFMFAYAQALAASMQNFGIPSQIVLALPYFMTIAVLVVSGIRSRMKGTSLETCS